MINRPEPLVWSAAVHEAGHTIVAWVLGFPVVSLDIGDADGAGRSQIENTEQSGVVDQIAICAAGMEAVELLDAGTHDQAGFSDQAKIVELLADHPEAEREAVRREGHAFARAVLKRHRGKLQAVAERLASAGHMDAEAFAGLVRIKPLSP
jgi:hypothetical protein